MDGCIASRISYSWLRSRNGTSTTELPQLPGKECFPKKWCSTTIGLLHTKGSKTECDNYRPISLRGQPAKGLTKILLDRIKALISHIIPEYQGGFQSNRSTIHQISVILQVIKKYLENGQNLYQLFIDFKQAFKFGENAFGTYYCITVSRQTSYHSLNNIYEGFRSQVQTVERTTEEFQISAMFCRDASSLLTCSISSSTV